MAFTVRFWKFAKKRNSTAIPADSATYLEVNCINKGSMDMLHPELVLQFSDGAEHSISELREKNYARIYGFERWYYVRSWRNEGPRWIVSLDVDALASWRVTLGSQNIYVYRSSSAYNGRINDTLYPTIAQYRRFNVTLPRMWSYGGATPLVAANGGSFVLGIIGDGTTQYYAMSSSQLTTFLAAIFDNTYYAAVLGEFGATEYPEAKVAIDPMQYISSVRFWPCGLAVPGTAWALHTTAGVTSIPVGPVRVQASASIFTAAGSYSDQTSYNTTYYDIPVDTTDFRHPQADERGDYMQLGPWTRYELIYPPWGILELDPADLLDVDSLRVRITADIRSGSALLTVSTLTAVGSGTRETVIARSVAPVGINCPLSKYQQTGSGVISRISDIMAGVSNLIREPAAAIKEMFSSDVKGQIPHLSTVGSEGSGAAMSGNPVLAVTHQYAAPDDLAGRGRPLMAKRTISAIPGYIMGDSDELSLPCTSEEMETIRAAVRGGFFYE